MHVDLLLDPFDARWDDLRDTALAAEAAGFDGLWTWDHLAGQAHGASGVLECWTALSALASSVPRLMLGPLVLNVANRRPAVLATMAATLQQVSGGRLLLGIGAGGGRRTPYPAEQDAIGVGVPPDPVRRAQVEEAIAVLRQLWTGDARPLPGTGEEQGRPRYPLGHGTGFLRPEPAPPIVVGAFGPKMAALAGRAGDGINLPAGAPDLAALIDAARAEHARARPDAPQRDAGGHQAAQEDADRFLVTVFTRADRRWLDPDSRQGARLAEVGVDRLILLLHPPFDRDLVEDLGRHLPARR